MAWFSLCANSIVISGQFILRHSGVSRGRGKGKNADDTQMALLIAQSLLEKKGFMAQDRSRQGSRCGPGPPQASASKRRRLSPWLATFKIPRACAARYYASRPDDSAGRALCNRIVTFLRHSDAGAEKKRAVPDKVYLPASMLAEPALTNRSAAANYDGLSLIDLYRPLLQKIRRNRKPRTKAGVALISVPLEPAV